MHHDHRDGSRRPFEAEVSLEYGDCSVPLDALDISPSGIYLASEVLPEEGDSLVLRFELPDGGGPLWARGAVARVNVARRDPMTGIPRRPGIGVRFERLHAEARRRLAHFAEALN